MTRDRLAQELDVSRETLQRLECLVDHVVRWTSRINLVAPSTLPDIWTRHILDSAQLWRHRPALVTHWADLGSGGGFPGLVIAALAADTGMRVTLVESDQRKAAFLRVASQAMGVTPAIHATRIEDTPPLTAHVISARALAPVPRLLDLALPHLAPGGSVILPLGAGTAVPDRRDLDSRGLAADTQPSITNPESTILVLTQHSPVAPAKG